MNKSAQPDLLVRCAARLGEGVCWHPVRKAVSWVDILGGRIFEFADGCMTAWECGQMVGAVAPAIDSSYIAAMHDGIRRFHPENGTHTLLAKAPYDTSAFRFNDGKVDAQGRFWVGTLSLRGEERASALYCSESGGPIRQVLGGVGISNGLAWSSDGRTLYFIDTLTRAVQRFRVDNVHGTISGGEVAVSFGEDEGLPDGCAIDRDGNLWVAHWGGSRITQSDPRTGRRLRTVGLPVRNVTSCAFGGPGLDLLFISTARCEDVEEELAGSVFVLEPGVVGSPCHLAYGDE